MKELLPWLPSIVLMLVALIGGVFALWNRRAGERAARKRPLPPTWPEMWDQIDELRTSLEDLKRQMAERDRAFTNILTDAAEQWPKDAPGPVFAAEDLAILKDTITIPPRWRRARPA